MPDPRDQMDDDTVFVPAHTRSKPGRGGKGKKDGGLADQALRRVLLICLALLLTIGLFAIFIEPLRMLLLALVLLFVFVIGLAFGVGKLAGFLFNKIFRRE